MPILKERPGAHEAPFESSSRFGAILHLEWLNQPVRLGKDIAVVTIGSRQPNYKALSAEHLAKYEREGYIFPLPALSVKEVSWFRSRFEELESWFGTTQQPIRWSHLHFRWAYDLSTHPVVLDAIEDMLGPEIIVWGTLIICKHPHTRSYTSWHQDGAYTELDSTQSVSAWIALTESTLESGCLRVVAGSHKRKVPHRETVADDNLLNRGQQVEADISESQVTNIILNPGQMSLHHINLIHGSNENHSDQKRIGFIIRFVTPRLKRCDFPVVRARGRSAIPHLQLLEKPPGDDLRNGIARHAEFARQFARLS
jgi:hypothetical protein